jgi:hypothetical protein
MAERDSLGGRRVSCKIGHNVQRCCDHVEPAYLDIWLGVVEHGPMGSHLSGKEVPPERGSGQNSQGHYHMVWWFAEAGGR